MIRHQNQVSMSIIGGVIGQNKFHYISVAAILNFARKKNSSMMTKWHHADFGSVCFVLSESQIKRCMYSKTRLGHKCPFCRQTSMNIGYHYAWAYEQRLWRLFLSSLHFLRQSIDFWPLSRTLQR